ncbi:DUF3034 family protein [Ideonella sp. DXS29W]|uniref:DUF3034 family protein n=1 Tax=Ideonella lacteola TaxID=2984193 RepID=A0ABU9BUP2_9BURK
MTRQRPPLALALTALALTASLPTARAEEPAPPLTHGNGKLLLTGGVSSIDGAAGGGLTPWAVTASYATRHQFGATAHATRVVTQDYAMNAAGAAVGIDDRFELSIARQDFNTGATGTALGLPGLHLKQDIVGLKWRFAGDAVLDSDRWMPQLAIGLEHKRADAAGLEPTLKALGADLSGTDLYLSATKLLLAQGVLLNGTLRLTRANQNGLLGFGGTAHDAYRLQPEVSIAWLLRKDLAIGAEYRAKPDNLNPSILGEGLKEDDWADLFVAWAPNKHISMTLAYVDLGHIVPAVITQRQTGAYLSAQIAF